MKNTRRSISMLSSGECFRSRTQFSRDRLYDTLLLAKIADCCSDCCSDWCTWHEKFSRFLVFLAHENLAIWDVTEGKECPVWCILLSFDQQLGIQIIQTTLNATQIGVNLITYNSRKYFLHPIGTWTTNLNKPEHNTREPIQPKKA